MSAPATTAITTGPAIPLQAADPCVHCGFCLPTCASYRVLGTEMDSPRGRIHTLRALEAGELELDATVADVRRVAKQYLTDSQLTITTLNPTGTAPQSTATVAGKTDTAIQKIELPNGLRLLVREDPKLPLVDVRVLMKGGVIAETAGNNGVTKLTARLLLKGTKSRTAEQIADEIESVGGSIDYFAGNNSFGLAAHVMKPDLDRALNVLADVVQNPTFPADMLEREREVQLAEIKAEQEIGRAHV